MEGDRTQRAALLLEHNRPAEAEKELRAHLSQVPHDVHALMLLSHSLTIQDKDKEAVEVAKQAVATAPDLDATHYHLAKAYLGKHDLVLARASAQHAVALDPEDANNRGLLALVLHHLNDHDGALRAAEEGLALDPEHLGCLNVRSAELAHLKRFAEADSNMEKALELDPENPYTHSNTGWAALRRGDHAKAMEHFREALRREPGLENARSGMVEALKARYWIYRQWLKYVFWVSNLKSGTQRFFIIGIWVLARVVGSVSSSVPYLKPIGGVIIGTYVVFAFSSWVVTPLTNLLLRLNHFGRYVLNREEKLTSTFTGIALSLVPIGIGSFIFLRYPGFLLLAVYGFLMMIPMASMFNADKPLNQRIRIGYAIGLALIGAFAVAWSFINGDPFNLAALLFGVGAIAYQWIASLILR